MKYYIAENIESPYGDYGDIIFTGYIQTFYWEKVEHTYNNRKVFKDEMRDLEIAELIRTGPYVPEIYIVSSDAFAMTEDFMENLMRSDLKGIDNLKPTIKKQIVNLPWKNWTQEDWENHIETLYEPEDSIERGEHDESLALSMPNVFYFKPITTESELSIQEDNGVERYFLNKAPTHGLDVFMASNMLWFIVSENFKKFVDEAAPNIFSFSEVVYGNN